MHTPEWRKNPIKSWTFHLVSRVVREGVNDCLLQPAKVDAKLVCRLVPIRNWVETQQNAILRKIAKEESKAPKYVLQRFRFPGRNTTSIKVPGNIIYNAHTDQIYSLSYDHEEEVYYGRQRMTHGLTQASKSYVGTTVRLETDWVEENFSAEFLKCVRELPGKCKKPLSRSLPVTLIPK